MTTPFPQALLGLKYEILVLGAWTDITGFVQSSVDTVITVPRGDETSQATFSQATFTLLNGDGRFSPENTSGAYYPYIARNVQCRISLTAASSSGDSYSGYRFWGEATTWIPQQDSSGNYQYCNVTVCGVLRRYNQGAKIGSPMDRYYRRLDGTDLAPYGAWPAEDGSDATELGSAVNGVPAMSVTGSPNLASDATFGGSDPIPVLNGSVWHGTTQAAETPPGTGSLTEFTPGTYTWTCPPGVTSVSVSCIGSGAGGGWCATTDTKGGGGGGAGASAGESALAVTPGVTYTYVVPAGGAPGTQLAAPGDGAAATFTGDSVTCSANGGSAGGNASGNAPGSSDGGAGGTAGSNETHHAGGAGATALTDGAATFHLTINGKAGATGGGTNTRAGNVTGSWKCPSGTSTVDVHANSAGGGGGQGDGASGGGNGGGGGSYAGGNVDVTPGTVYAPYAGSGGNGGSGTGHGDPGGNSGFVGDGGSSVEAGGGGGGKAGGGDGEAGGVINGTGYSGGAGGDGGASSAATGGGGGGGGAGAVSFDAGGDGGAGSGRNPGSAGGGTGGHGGKGGYGRILTGTGAGSGQTAGATGSAVGGGGGGGGATSDTVAADGTNGGGGGPGQLAIAWTNNGPTGGGGGSSAGPAAAGNAGNGDGAGGAAVTGGGAGGDMDAGGSGPGGGGGGQDPTGSAPGAGAPGQVAFSWDGGTTSPVPGDIVRFLLHVDATGTTDGAVVARAVTFGTVQNLDVIYHTANGGSLEFKGYTGGTTYFDQTGCFSNLNGTPVLVSFGIAGGSDGGGGGGGGGGGTPATVPSPPILGMYQTNGAFPVPGASAWPSGSTTNLSATYMAWGQDWPTYGGAFVDQCNANSLIPFVELEPWHAGPTWDETPLFTDITGGAWDEWLNQIGTAIAATGQPCILTFGHEPNVSGQYPWSQGDTGSGPGGGTLTAAEWIAGWNYVRNKVNSTAGGYALWMWACSAYTGGTTVSPAPWWPGESNVDMVGVDGYPTTQYDSPGQNPSLGTFAGQIQPTVTIIRDLGWTDPIFISETNLAQMVASGGQSITDFVAAMHTAGCSGILEFEDAAWGLPQMTSAQWTEYNDAIASDY